MEVVQYNRPSTRLRLITPGNGAMLGTQCCPLLLAYWAFSSSGSQISLDEWESLLLILCITSICATMSTLYMGPMTGVAEEGG